MFKELRNKFSKIVIIFGGIFILFTFLGIFSATYISNQKEINYILRNSLKTAVKAENLVPQKESCSFLLIYVDNNGKIERYDNGEVKFDLFKQNSPNSNKELTKWFVEIADNIAQTQFEDKQSFKLNKRYYAYDSIEYFNIQKPDKKCLLFSIYDYTSYVRVNNATFTFLMIGYFVVILLLSFSAITIADKTVEPVKEAFIKQKELIANASHELKTPLTVINTNLSILEDNKDKSIESQSKWLNNIIEQTSRMNNLIYQMLDLSKTESLLASEKKEIIHLNDLLEKLLMEFEANAFEKRIEIQANLEANIQLACNKENMIKLFTILIDNAIKYTNVQGKIDINLSQKKSKIIFCIENTGKGIAKTNIDKIFQRFYKEDESYKADSSHSFGLGLAIAKAIVNQLNGTISAESIENEYTKFIVKIPNKV